MVDNTLTGFHLSESLDLQILSLPFKGRLEDATVFWNVCLAIASAIELLLLDQQVLSPNKELPAVIAKPMKLE